ncbi:MAG: 3'-5' exonuclease [Verrucomicrobiota bacterium]
MDLNWDDLPIHVIDFEGGPQCGIVEYGVVSLRGMRIEGTETRLCRPKAKIPRHEEAVHGIRSDEASMEMPFQNEWDLFADLRESGPLAAHFASAENRMLKSAFPYPRKSPDWARPDKKVANWGPWVDTGVMYRELGDCEKSLKLEDLIRRYQLQNELEALAARFCPEGRRSYHCALFDALASALLLLNYCQNLADERLSLRHLLAESQGSGVKRQEVKQQNLF